jgi:hypothetical protein
MNAAFCVVGDDDSGPEDTMDDEDLECEQPFAPQKAP